MVPLILAGAALGAVGTLWSNKDKAEQEARNAWFYRRQAQFAKEASRREMQLAMEEASRLKGLQVGALAKGGADVGSGSAAGVLAMSAARALSTIEAIKLKGELDYTLAMSRGDAAQDTADTYGSLAYNLLTVAGDAIKPITKAYGMMEDAPEKPAKKPAGGS